MAEQSEKRRRPGKGEGDSRDERLRTALRANLARRKAQARARSDKEAQQDDTGREES